MNYPLWRCRHCGTRLYEHIEGDYQCLNCDRRYDPVTVEETAV